MTAPDQASSLVTAPSPRWRRFRFAARLAPVVLAILLLGEVAARCLPAPRQRTPFMEDPIVVARLRPGWAGGHVRINAQGFRDDEPVGERPDDERRRVLFVGDSLVYANEVAFRDTFPERLERLLGPGVRCLNSGVPSYTTHHERLLVEQLAPELRPDVVVLVVSLGTDLVELLPIPRGFDGVARKVQIGPDQQLSVVEVPPEPERFNASRALADVSMLWRRIRNSRLYQRLKPKGRTRGRAEDGQPRPLDPEAFRLRKVTDLAPLRVGASDRPPLSGAWAHFEAELALIQRAASAAGATLIVAGVPEELQVDPELLRSVCALAQPPIELDALDLEQPQRRCAAACARVGVTWVDLLPALRGSPRQPVFMPGSMHLNADGHDVVARELARAVDPLTPGRDRRE